MFTVTFSKSIWNGEDPDSATSVAYFTRKVTLPFVPVPGIEFFWGYDIPRAVTKVIWEFDEQAFICTLADECYQSIGSTDDDFDALIQSTNTSGWALIEQRPVERTKSHWDA
jgi:hypothetical protein